MSYQYDVESSAGSRETERSYRKLHIVQGEQHVTDEPDLVLVTILGSCVAACIRDPIARIGGMNHFLLPGTIERGQAGEAERYAVHSMELLVNALLGRGASRNRLEAKVFGGACTMSGLADVGSQNAEFAISFLRREFIEVVGQCLLGSSGRRIQYWPVSGRARRSFMEYKADTSTMAVRKPTLPSGTGVLELF